MGSGQSNDAGSNNSIIKVTKQQYEANEARLADLKKTIENYSRTISINQETIHDLRSRNTKLESENNIYKGLKREYSGVMGTHEKLKAEHQEMKLKLEKYESMPILQEIVDLRERLLNFRKATKEAEQDNSLEEASKNFRTKIENVKTENSKMEQQLKQKTGEIVNQSIKNDLVRAERDLGSIKDQYRKFCATKQEKLKLMLYNIKESAANLDTHVSSCLSDVREQLDNDGKRLSDMQGTADNITQQEQEKSEKILTILEYENNTFKSLLQLPHLSTASSSEEWSSTQADKCTLLPDRDKGFHVIMHNLEEAQNYAIDKQNVIKIIQSLCYIPSDDIKTFRFGQRGTDPRIIKITIRTKEQLSQILSNKWKLDEGLHESVRIRPYNPNKKRSNADVKSQKNDSIFAPSPTGKFV